MKHGEPSNKNLVASKLLIYLWDDVVRHNRQKLFKTEIRTFSNLNSKFLSGEEVFQFSYNQLDEDQHALLFEDKDNDLNGDNYDR
jgi:hypothetical protein